MNLPGRVSITEVGPRDGLQNEDTLFALGRKVEFVDRLSSTGLRRIEAASFVSPKAIPQMRDAGDLMRGLRRASGVTYVALVPNERGATDAIAAGADEIATVVSASETHNQRNINRSVAQSLDAIAGVAQLAAGARLPWTGYISTAFGCPYEGAVDPARVLEIAERLVALGAGGIALGDTIGAAEPRQAGALVGALRARLAGVPLRLHFHDTRGTALANVLAALQAGADEFDASVGGLGGCPYAPGAAGNVATEDLVYMLHRMGIETGVDLAALIEVARWIEGVVGRALPGRVKGAGDGALQAAG